MDWTIVASVLVALLLWPVVLASVGALVFLTIATIFRGRLQRLMEQKMAHCKGMCKPGHLATTSAGPAAAKSCQ